MDPMTNIFMFLDVDLARKHAMQVGDDALSLFSDFIYRILCERKESLVKLHAHERMSKIERKS